MSTPPNAWTLVNGMSEKKRDKARDWLDAVARAKSELEIVDDHLAHLRRAPLRCDDAEGKTIAYLMETGDIWVRPDGIPAAYRNKFVRWILDTFAEPEQLTIRAVESAGTV